MRCTWLALALLALGGCQLSDDGRAFDGPPSPDPSAGEAAEGRADQDPNAGDDLPVNAIGFSWIDHHRLAAMSRPGAVFPLANDLAYLQFEGVEILISLTPEPLDSSAVAAAGIDLEHIPIADFTAPTQAQLGAFVRVVRDAARQGRSVGVHCRAGLGRSGTMAAGWFVYSGMSAHQAIATIRALRPGSIETASQEQSIFEFERNLRSRPRSEAPVSAIPVGASPTR